MINLGPPSVASGPGYGTVRPMPVFHDERRRLRDLVADPDTLILPRPHAVRRMAERNVSRLVAERLVGTGKVVAVETEVSGEERWSVEGADTDGHAITVVCVPNFDDRLVEIVTVF
jgi:hypothetical protein